MNDNVFVSDIPQEVKKTLHAADSRLDERLKKVFVTSRDQNLEVATLLKYINEQPIFHCILPHYLPTC